MDESAVELHFLGINKKLDEYGGDLKSIRKYMSKMAVQATQIRALQAMQTETRSDVNELERRIAMMANWQASCPRQSIGKLWTAVMAIALTFATAFITHVFVGVK
jgi:hypothetical protein